MEEFLQRKIEQEKTEEMDCRKNAQGSQKAWWE
jgi:hypothetical protein